MERRKKFVVVLLVFAIAMSGCATFPQPAEPEPAPISTGGGDTIVIQPPAAKCCKPSLIDFLGIPQIVGAFRNVVRRIQSRLGTRFPGLEPTPELKVIADPANVDSPYPSVAVAAEVKAEEDAAAQKIKGINYLASLGCSGCYPDVEKALLASLEDCNEGVRHATVVGLRNAAGHPCCNCRSGTCCSPKVMEALGKIAYGTNEFCCPTEPSARVRRIARLAMYACSGATAPEEEEVIDIEGPSPADAPLEGPLAEGPPEPLAVRSSRRNLVHSEGGQSAAPMFASLRDPASQSKRVLAVVHSEPIFESRIRPRVERRIASAPKERVLNIQEIKAIWEEELDRAIDRKLVCHAARQAGYIMQASWQGESDDDPPAGDENEEALAESWLKTNVVVDENIPPHQTWRHYRTRMSQYTRPAQVRWEIVLAPWSRFASRQEALRILTQIYEKSLGERTAPLSPRAREVAIETVNWTRREDLPSPQAAELLFAMPVGTLSSILENDEGCFVVRLLERRLPKTVSLDEAMPQIRADILAARRQSAEEAYIASLRRGAHTWKTDSILR